MPQFPQINDEPNPGSFFYNDYLIRMSSSNFQNKPKNNSPQPESNPSPSYKIFYKHNQSLICLKFNDPRQRVEEAISSAIDLLTDQYMIKLNPSPLQYALYAANRNGQKLPDGMEISMDQRIRGTGLRYFYLQYLSPCKMSISTHINLQRKYGFEKMPRKGATGCCSIFPSH